MPTFGVSRGVRVYNSCVVPCLLWPANKECWPCRDCLDKLERFSHALLSAPRAFILRKKGELRLHISPLAMAATSSALLCQLQRGNYTLQVRQNWLYQSDMQRKPYITSSWVFDHWRQVDNILETAAWSANCKVCIAAVNRGNKLPGDIMFTWVFKSRIN